MFDTLVTSIDRAIFSPRERHRIKNKQSIEVEKLLALSKDAIKHSIFLLPFSFFFFPLLSPFLTKSGSKRVVRGSRKLINVPRWRWSRKRARITSIVKVITRPSRAPSSGTWLTTDLTALSPLCLILIPEFTIASPPLYNRDVETNTVAPIVSLLFSKETKSSCKGGKRFNESKCKMYEATINYCPKFRGIFESSTFRVIHFHVSRMETPT